MAVAFGVRGYANFTLVLWNLVSMLDVVRMVLDCGHGLVIESGCACGTIVERSRRNGIGQELNGCLVA